jgi:hypothetical protein
MTSRQFIDFLQNEFAEAGVNKVGPDQETLALASEGARRRHHGQQAIDAAVQEAAQFEVTVPPALRK